MHYFFESRKHDQSDHFPVVMTINVAQNPALTVDHSKIVQVNEQTKFIEKIIWQGDKEQIYRDQLSSDEGQRVFEAAKAKLENNVDVILLSALHRLVSV